MKKEANDFSFSEEVTFEDYVTEWTSPSNIALVKYWGKFENQIPANPSISFTLDNCHTQTKVTFSSGNDFSFEVWMNGERKASFEPKIKTFIDRIIAYCPYLNHYALKIETSNTFPHSSGIASSASGLSALAMCIMSLEYHLTGKSKDDYFVQKASFLARLGSGSAARSLYPCLASWGETEGIVESSNLFATPFTGFHSNFENYQDCILLIDEGEKVVSSTVGHNLMNNHPYAANRFDQAHSNLSQLLDILSNGDLDKFIELVESEALTLHAMMMTSNPYFILMKPNTLKAIEAIWKFRTETGSKICFTLDAGANVHVLYPFNEKDAVNAFINEKLTPFCQDGKVIFDQVGNGPKQLG